MNELQSLTKTPVEVEAGGKTYKLAPMEVRQLAEFEAWAEQRFFNRLGPKVKAIQSLKISAEDKQRQIDRLIQKAESDSADALARAREMSSVAGVVKALRMCFGINHPDMDDQEFDAILRAVDLKELERMMDKANSDGSEKNA